MGPDASISGCSDSQFLSFSSEADDWYQLQNWVKIRSADTFVLDEEEIPCQSDSITFPSSSTFMVKERINSQIKKSGTPFLTKVGH